MSKALVASLLKDISEDSAAELADIFGDDVFTLDPTQQSALWDLLDRTGKVGQWLSFSVEAMDSVDQARLDNVEYLVWQTAEDEMVCPYCEPLNNKVVSADEVEDAVPAHPNCRCTLITIEEQYGEPKPVLYYYSIPMDYESWRAATKGLAPLQPEITWLDPEQYTGLPDAYKAFVPMLLKALKDSTPITDKPKGTFEGKTGWWITMENGQHVFMGEDTLNQRSSTLEDGRTVTETNLGNWYVSKTEIKFPEKWTGPDGTNDESIAGKSVTLTHNDLTDMNDAITWANVKNDALYGSQWERSNGNDLDVVNRLADHYGWDKEKANLALEAAQGNPQVWNNSFGHSKAENGTWAYNTMTGMPHREVEWVPGGFGKYGNTAVLIDDRITKTENISAVKEAIDTFPKAGTKPISNLVLTTQTGEEFKVGSAQFVAAGHFDYNKVVMFDFDNKDAEWLKGRGIWHEYSHGIWHDMNVGYNPKNLTYTQTHDMMRDFAKATDEEGAISPYSESWLNDPRWPREGFDEPSLNVPGYNENFAEMSAYVHVWGPKAAFYQSPKEYAAWKAIMSLYGWKEPRVGKTSKSYNPDQPRDERGRWTGEVVYAKPEFLRGPITEIPLSRSKIEGFERNARIGQDPQKLRGIVNQYVQDIKEGKPIKYPVVQEIHYEGGQTGLRLVDGWHRMTAMEKLGLRTVKVELVGGRGASL